MKDQHEGKEHDEGDEVSQKMGRVGMQKWHGHNANHSSLRSGDKAVRKDFLRGDDFQKENGQDAADENENERDVTSSDVAYRPALLLAGVPSADSRITKHAANTASLAHLLDDRNHFGSVPGVLPSNRCSQ